ncbi:nitrilase-related carbon-nitrogen hydrolase, partial [Caenimonas koreensis]
MKVAALQMVSAPDVATNLDTARALLREAAQAGAELALLPEYFCLMGHKDSDKLAVREALGDGAIQRCLAGAAREHGLWVVGGTMPLVGSDDAHVLNTSLVYGPDGERVARYDKIHLFKFDNG